MFQMGGAVGMTPGPVLTNLLRQDFCWFIYILFYQLTFIYPYFLISPVLKDIVGLLSYSIHWNDFKPVFIYPNNYKGVPWKYLFT